MNALAVFRSATSFGAMAEPGQADQLRNAGILQIQYRDTFLLLPIPCNGKINGPTHTILQPLLNGDGDLASVELKQALEPESCNNLNSGTRLRAPFSLRLTSLNTIVATDVIPAGWTPGPGKTYTSLVNFDA
ncbi:hypothetical protein GQ457_05G000160 [Hibiscus cannabinus]